MSKYWTYTPNEYTTSITFTVTKKDGESDAFTYSLENEEWQKKSGDEGNLTVESDQGTVTIHNPDDNSVTKIECTCSNASKTAKGPTVNVKQIVFLGQDDVKLYTMPNGVTAGRIYGLNETMWHYISTPPSPVIFTDFTDEITMPSIQSAFAQFNGFAILDCTAPHVVTDISGNPLEDNQYNGLAHWLWYCPKGTKKVTLTNGGFNYSNSNEECGLSYLNNDNTLNTYSYNGTYYAIPLYYYSGNSSLYMQNDNNVGHNGLRDFDDVRQELYPGKSVQQ